MKNFKWKSGGGKNCFFAVLQTEDGVGWCMGKQGKSKICWHEVHDCLHPLHQVNGKVSPAWGDICLLVEDGKVVEGELHLPVSKLLVTDNLDLLLNWRAPVKKLKHWINVCKAGQTPNGSCNSSSWTEADCVSKESVARLDSNPRKQSETLKDI